jgi:hypothetical protein
METLEVQRNILYGLCDLPVEKLQEVLDFVFFLRKKTFEPESFEQEIRAVQSEKEEIPEELGLLLEERLAKYEANPENAIKWTDLRKKIVEKYNYEI